MSELLSLKEPVDAILFSANTLAVDGLKYINKHNIKIPEQLAVISFDESDALDLFHPQLTYIKQPLQQMGETATKLLLENIEKNNKIMQVKMDGELVVRNST